MRKIIWAPKAQKVYAEIVDFLLQRWSLKEVQQFVDQVENTISILQKGNVEFRITKYGKLHVAVTSEKISVYYRIHSSKKVEIVRVWDSRQKPSKLLKS